MRHIGTKIWMLVITVGVLAYFGVQVMRYYDDPLLTTPAYTYLAENGSQLSGYVVRTEQVLPDEGNGLLRLERKEGERISKGGTVAVVYSNQDAYDRQAEIEHLDEQISQLEYAQESMLGSEISLKLDSQIMQNILQYRSAVAADRLDGAEEHGHELRSLVLKRDYTYSDDENLSEQLRTLQAQRKALRAKSQGAVRNIKSPCSGLYSAVVDGYETILTTDILSELTPSRLANLQPDSNVHSAVGKLVTDDAWYYVASMDVKEAQMLKERAADLKKKGASLLLRFAKNIDRDLQVTIERISAEENGRCVVVFQGKTYLQELTLLRQQSAEVIYETVEGIRVPSAALRVDVHREEDSTVEIRTVGVYCVVGAKAAFKPVEVLYSGDDYSLVRATATTEKLRLRNGDEVVVTAKDIFSGKVIG